jgi:hypothetical protein
MGRSSGLCTRGVRRTAKDKEMLKRVWCSFAVLIAVWIARVNELVAEKSGRAEGSWTGHEGRRGDRCVRDMRKFVNTWRGVGSRSGTGCRGGGGYRGRGVSQRVQAHGEQGLGGIQGCSGWRRSVDGGGSWFDRKEHQTLDPRRWCITGRAFGGVEG